MVGWHHWLSGHEFEQTLGDDEGQGSLVCMCVCVCVCVCMKSKVKYYFDDDMC